MMESKAMRGLVRRIAVASLLVVLAGSVAVAGQETGAPVAPDVAAANFYRWYLKELAENHDPIGQDQKFLAPYVSASLLRAIEKMRKSPEGMDADYFLKAQDYLDGWVHHVSTSGTKLQTGYATTVVMLGEKSEEQRRLLVTMVKESGVWKVRRVQRLAEAARMRS